MTEAELQDDEISVFALGTVLLRNRWRITRWMFIGAVLAALSVFSKPVLYSASASFVPQGSTDAARSGLASIAGQFGVSLPASGQSVSPEFYSMLLKSRPVLRDIAYDTVVVREMGGRRVSFFDLFEIVGGSAARREEQGVRVLRGIVSTSVVKPTGVVQLTVATRWPSVSLAVATALVSGVNEYNQRTRQGQAAAERKFVEGRLAVASADLRAAEDRLERFLRTNREFGSSAELTFQGDRLRRDLAFQQQLYTSLIQAYEEVRIREVRDTPVITVIEAPSVSTNPEGRGRRMRVLLGLAIGGFVGVLITLISGIVAHRRNERNPEASEFLGALGELKGEVLGPVRWLRERIRR